MWSIEEHDPKITDNSENLVKWMSSNHLSLLNEKGVTTFFRKDYQSVLDLTWASPQASARLSDFLVAYHLHSGSDHHPTTWQSSFSPLPPSNNSSYLFHDNNREAWESDFSATIMHNWNLANLTTEIKDKDSYQSSQHLHG